MPRSRRWRTLVLGGGLAGSLAALVCARAGHDVTLIERDPTTVGVRPGAPHARQLHNILGRAQRHLGQLVPGFVGAFAARGGQRARVATQTHVYEFGALMPERDLGLEIWSSRKSLVDEVVAEAVGGVAVRRWSGRRAEGLQHSGGRVTGVRVAGEIVAGDLVIDAMGAKSPLRGWLPGRVPVHEHVVRQWYATMPVGRPPAHREVPDFWLTFPTHPRTRGGLVSPVDPRTWHVSLSGGPADVAPRTVAEFLAYASTLERPDIAELLTRAEPAGSPQVFGKPVATWRRYDLAPELPSGVLSVGDAVADLNPLLGHGISVMAWELHDLAALLETVADIGELTVRFREQVAEAVRTAWDLTTLYEPETGRGLDGHARTLAVPVTLTADQCERIARVVASSPAAHREYVEVWHLLRPPSALQDIAARDPVTAGRGPTA